MFFKVTPMVQFHEAKRKHPAINIFVLIFNKTLARSAIINIKHSYCLFFFPPSTHMQILFMPFNDSAPNPAGSIFNNLPKVFLKIKKNKRAIKTETTDNKVKSLISFCCCQQILESHQWKAAPGILMKNWKKQMAKL